MTNNAITRRSYISSVAAAPLLTIDAQAATDNPTKWKLVVGCDHAGFPLKGPLIQALQSWGHTVKDIGVYNTDPVDFPDVGQTLSPAAATSQAAAIPPTPQLCTQCANACQAAVGPM